MASAGEERQGNTGTVEEGITDSANERMCSHKFVTANCDDPTDIARFLNQLLDNYGRVEFHNSHVSRGMGSYVVIAEVWG